MESWKQKAISSVGSWTLHLAPTMFQTFLRPCRALWRHGTLHVKSRMPLTCDHWRIQGAFRPPQRYKVARLPPPPTKKRSIGMNFATALDFFYRSVITDQFRIQISYLYIFFLNIIYFLIYMSVATSHWRCLILLYRGAQAIDILLIFSSLDGTSSVRMQLCSGYFHTG